jgi:hypothetical protein
MQMSAQEVICLSQMTAHPGKATTLKEALLHLVEKTLKEPGCVAFELWEELPLRTILCQKRVPNPRRVPLGPRSPSNHFLNDCQLLRSRLEY